MKMRKNTITRSWNVECCDFPVETRSLSGIQTVIELCMKKELASFDEPHVIFT